MALTLEAYNQALAKYNNDPVALRNAVSKKY